jgi:hypothetical protein
LLRINWFKAENPWKWQQFLTTLFSAWMTPYGYPYAAAAANAGFQLYANAFYNPAANNPQSAIVTSTESSASSVYDPSEAVPTLPSNTQFYPNTQLLAQSTPNETSETAPIDYSAPLAIPGLNSSG